MAKVMTIDHLTLLLEGLDGDREIKLVSHGMSSPLMYLGVSETTHEIFLSGEPIEISPEKDEA